MIKSVDEIIVLEFEDEDDQCFEVKIAYHYNPPVPAFTPRGEYAPIDPPEAAEVYATSHWVRPVGDKQWNMPLAPLAGRIDKWLESDEVRDLLILDAEQANYTRGYDG